MLTKEKLYSQLEAMGAVPGVPVIMHTSLKKVGPIDGRAEALLDWLIEFFTRDGGLFCVPTHTWHLMFNKDVPTLDLNKTETCLGAFTRVAAAHKKAVRSPHPTHSMVVFGDDAEKFVECEKNSITMVPPTGCYGKFYENKGKILLVGVGQESNTYMHSVEERLGVPNRNDKTTTETSIKYKDGRIEYRSIYQLLAEGIDDVSRQYPNYEAAFRYHGCITDGYIGDAKTQFCDAEGIYKVMKMIFERSAGCELLSDAAPISEEYYI